MNSSSNFNYTKNKNIFPREIPITHIYNDIYNLKSNSLNENYYYQYKDNKLFLKNNDKIHENNPKENIYGINENIFENDEEYNILRRNIQILQQKISNMDNLNNIIQDNNNFITSNNNININYINQRKINSNIENKRINNNNNNYELPFYNPLVGNYFGFENEDKNLKDSINDSSINESII